MSPLLRPEARPKRHTCEPPSAPGYTGTLYPGVGSTWDCPTCRKVWIVRATLDSRGRAVPAWFGADEAVSARHYERLEATGEGEV